MQLDWAVLTFSLVNDFALPLEMSTLPGQEKFMSSSLQLILFGAPEVLLDGKKLYGFITVKSRALLYYLAMKPGAHSRPVLATLLWPESSETAAAKNLRNILSNLRKLVGSHLEITRQTVTFLRQGPYSLDVEQFTAFLEQYRRGRKDIGDLEQAVSLYTGDFLEGFHVPDTDLYEQWMAEEREQLRQAQLVALLTLATSHAAQANFPAVLEYATRLMALDNLNESGLQIRMSVLARIGQRSEAIALYQSFCDLLAAELGVSPMAETTALYEQIKDGANAPVVAPFNILHTPSPMPVQDWYPAKPPPGQLQSVDWGEIPAPVSLYGRKEELQKLQAGVMDDGRRIIAVTGIGGVGKTSLVARLARELVVPTAGEPASPEMKRTGSDFEFIIWRSLMNAPPLTAILRDWLMILSGRQIVNIPTTVANQLKLLQTYLQKSRSLFVLDNFETIMTDKYHTSDYRPGYVDYDQLLQRFAGGEHQGCLLITSRELPRFLQRIQQGATQIQILQLSGLPDESGLHLLRAGGLVGPDSQMAELVRQYSGNPLALNLVAHTAQTLLGGNIDLLLEEVTVFGGIWDVLEEQFSRLAPLEKQIMAWLAIEREPVEIQTIGDNLAGKPHRRQLLEALHALHARSLLELVQQVDQASRILTGYTLQNVVMEYVTDYLVESIGHEVEALKVEWLHQVSLTRAQAKEHVQESQRRLFLAPVAKWLIDRLGSTGAEEKLHQLLEMVRTESTRSSGYAGANLLHLFLALGTDLRGFDFSGIAISQADLRKAFLNDVSFRESNLSGTLFRDTFGLVTSVAFSPNGQLFAASSGDGTVAFWRLFEHRPHLVIYAGFSLDMAFSPDGQQLACGGNDRVIRLWDVQTGHEIRRLIAHSGSITSVAFSPDGSTLYSSSDDLTVGVWEMNSGKLLRQLPAPDIFTLALAISPDSKFLAEVGYEGQARIWQIESWTIHRRLDLGHNKKITTVAFSPDGQTLATGDENNTVCVWHVHSGEKLAAHRFHSNIVLSVAYHPDGSTLASASADKTVRLWNWREERMEHVLHGSQNWVTSVAYSPDGRLLASGGYDSVIRLWQSADGQLLHVLHGSLKRVNEVIFSPEGQLLASASFNQPVRLWDVENGRLLHTFQGHNGTVRRLVISPDNRTLLVGGDDSTIWVWDTQSGRLRRTLTVAEPFVRTMALSPDGLLLAVGAGLGRGTLYVGDLNTLNLHSRDDDIRAGLAANICFTPDGKSIVYSDQAANIKVLHVNEGAMRLTPTDHEALISNIQFSTDGTRMASQDRNGMLVIWQVAENGSLIPLTHHLGSGPNANYWNLSFSPDGDTIAFQIDGGNLGIQETSSGKLRRTIPETLYGERCLAFSRDGSMLITSSEDGRLRLWDVTTGAYVTTLQEGVTGTIDVNPQNGRVASSGAGGVIRIWDIHSGSCARELVQPGPYEGMDIANAKGLSPAQVATLKALGAVSNTP